MNLQQFEYIVAAERLGGFTKAAEYCLVTQPTLSAMIQKLEDELGVLIFDRAKQPVSPTPIGALIIKQAKEVLVRVGNMKNLVAEEKQSFSGVFRLGILPTIAPYLLPRFIPQFTARFPELDLRIVDMKTAEIKRALHVGEVDAGILAELPGFDGYSVSSLFYEQFYAYVSPESVLSKNVTIKTSDLVNEKLWLLDEGHCFRSQMTKFCQIKSAQRSQLAYSLGSLDTFMRMVESGKGVTFIPELAVMQLSDCQRQLAHEFAIPRPARHIVLLTNKNYIRQKLIGELVSQIRLSVPDEMHSLRAAQVQV